MPELNLTASEPVPADFDGDAFDDWVGGATISKRSVPIYGKPGLFAEYETLEREREKIEAEQEDGGELAGSGLGAINARLAEIYEEWVASKSTWTVRAIPSDEISRAQEILADEQGIKEPEVLEAPEEPGALPTRHTDQQAKSHTVSTNAYKTAMVEYHAKLPAAEKAATTYVDALNIQLAVLAVVTIDFADGRRVEAQLDEDGTMVEPAVSFTQLQKLAKRLGRRQILSILAAATAALEEEPTLDAPFSQATSKGDPT